jgi:hypothetical protein
MIFHNLEGFLRRLGCVSALVLLASCSGPQSSFVPKPATAVNAFAEQAKPINALLRFTIPPLAQRSPNLLSPLTKSIGIGVNGHAQQIFDTTPASPNCTHATSGTTCTVLVPAPIGIDTFSIATFSKAEGSGVKLDRSTAVVPITASGKVAHVNLGPVFRTNADSGPGSLRTAISRASSGDTLVYTGPVPATITLASALFVQKGITVAGPGMANLTVTGGGNSQILLIPFKFATVVSGVTLTQGRARNGGAIFNNGKLTLAADALTNNSSTQGGAVWSGGVASSLLVEESTFDSNAATTGDGGAVYNESRLPLAITASTFSNNATTGGNGGAVAYTVIGKAAQALTLTNDTFSGNKAANGGAVEDGPGPSGTVAPLNVANSAFSGNTASAAYVSYGGAIDSTYALTVGITGSTFTGNHAASGGAISERPAGQLTLTNDTFSQNTAGGLLAQGGAVIAGSSYSLYGAKVAGSGDTFDNNSATSGGIGSSDGALGGAIAAGAIDLTNSSFTGNTASGGTGTTSGGGALFQLGGGQRYNGILLDKDTFTSNSVSSGSGHALGGAVLGTITATNSTFKSNAANASGSSSDAEGGAAYPYGATFTNCTFDSNSATGSSGASGRGGAISGPSTLSADSITNNTASNAGGGVFTAANASIVNSTFSGNKVTAAGGVADGGGAIANTTYVQDTISGSTIVNNSVTGVSHTGGGAILNYNGSYSIYNSTIDANTSTGDGGGILNDKNQISYGTVALLNVTMLQNSAAGGGGNLANAPTAAINLENTIVAGGTASAGNDAYNNGTIASYQYNIFQVYPFAGSGTDNVGPSNHDRTGIDPLLLPLASNGGLTQTNADQTTSPGYDHVPLANCLTAFPKIAVDQRGRPRGDNGDGKCDVGAYENQTAPK